MEDQAQDEQVGMRALKKFAGARMEEHRLAGREGHWYQGIFSAPNILSLLIFAIGGGCTFEEAPLFSHEAGCKRIPRRQEEQRLGELSMRFFFILAMMQTVARKVFVSMVGTTGLFDVWHLLFEKRGFYRNPCVFFCARNTRCIFYNSCTLLLLNNGKTINGKTDFCERICEC